MGGPQIEVKGGQLKRLLLAIGAFGMVVFLLLAVLAPVLSFSNTEGSSWVGWGPMQTDLSQTSFPAPPSPEHLLGTDDRGRDVLARLIHGARVSIGFAFLVWFLSYGFGILLGALMGYLGGTIDLIGQRVVDIFESIPYLFFVMFAVSILGGSFFVLIAVNALFGWMMICLYVRGQVMANSKSTYVESIKALGASEFHVLFRHVLPASIFPALVFSPLALAAYVSTLVQLDFLGLGIEPPDPSWGELLSQANKHFPEAWWLLLYPGLAVLILLVCFQLISHGLQDKR